MVGLDCDNERQCVSDNDKEKKIMKETQKVCDSNSEW